MYCLLCLFIIQNFIKINVFFKDFEQDQRLKSLTIEFLDDIIYSPNLLPAEHKAASQLLRLITKEDPERSKVDLDLLLAPPIVSTKLLNLQIANTCYYVFVYYKCVCCAYICVQCTCACTC